MTADAHAEQYQESLRTLLASAEYNGALVIATPTGTLDGAAVAEAVMKGRAGSSKPVVTCLFGALFARLWYLQVLDSNHFQVAAQQNGIRLVYTPAPRGRILDRKGRVIVDNREINVLTVDRQVIKKNPDVKIHLEGRLDPYRGITTGPLADAVRSSVAFAFGKEPVFVREGGSIGAVITMERLLKVPVLFLGLSLPEHGYHAPNENFDWSQAEGGMAAFAKYFQNVAELKASR